MKQEIEFVKIFVSGYGYGNISEVLPIEETEKKIGECLSKNLDAYKFIKNITSANPIPAKITSIVNEANKNYSYKKNINQLLYDYLDKTLIISDIDQKNFFFVKVDSINGIEFKDTEIPESLDPNYENYYDTKYYIDAFGNKISFIIKKHFI